MNFLRTREMAHEAHLTRYRFISLQKAMKLSELASLVNGTVDGDPDLLISGLRDLDSADCGDITFISDLKHYKNIALNEDVHLPSFL